MDSELESNFCKNIVDMMRAQEGARLKSLELTMFASFLVPDLQKMGTDQVQQILRESLAVATYAL